MTRDQAIAYLHAGILRTDTCWVWLGPRQKPAGYSGVTLDGRWTYLHRISYEHHVGPIPAGLVIDHLCRRPYCMNPAHMEPVTRGENSRRGVRAKRDTLHCPHGHRVEGANLRIAANGRRRCLTCERGSGYKGTGNPPWAACAKGHPFPENAYVRPDGRGRQCKQCARDNLAARLMCEKAAAA